MPNCKGHFSKILQESAVQILDLNCARYRIAPLGWECGQSDVDSKGSLLAKSLAGPQVNQGNHTPH